MGAAWAEAERCVFDACCFAALELAQLVWHGAEA
jgi:hypothetical protein